MTISNCLWEPNKPISGAKLSSQQLFLLRSQRDLFVGELLLEGGRGGGKTSVLLMDFAKECGQGLGADWKGVLFARTFKDLENVRSKSQKIFHKCFPGIRFFESGSAYFWEWPTGERLYFRHIKSLEDYWSNYHGHEFSWQGWEELTAWPDLKLYQIMVSCLRSSNPKVTPLLRRRATSNPWGPGHGAVKTYFVDPAPTGKIIVDAEGNKRLRLYSPLDENQPLLTAQPRYLNQILGGVDDPHLVKAWKGGADRWEISAGAYFADCWSKGSHVLPNFKPPAHWKVTRSFDWGSAAPFACLWFAESPGEAITVRGKSLFIPRGSLILFFEYYGAESPNVGVKLPAQQVAKNILEIEKKLGLKGVRGVADSAMWAESDPRNSIYSKFEGVGCYFEPCAKGPGSRKAGWEECRSRLLLSISREGLPLEKPGFFVTDSCVNFIRTIPLLQRDKNDPDDIDTDAEDHIADAWRYRLTWRSAARTERQVYGL